MAIKINTGFEVGAGVPIDNRLLMTKAEMLEANDNLFPEVYFAICKDDGHLYAYNKNGEPNGETGKFSYIATGTYELPTATSEILGGVKIGETVDIVDGVINPKVSTDEKNAIKVSDTDKGLFVEDKTEEIEELFNAIQTLNTFCESNKKFSEVLNGGKFVDPSEIVDAVEVDVIPDANVDEVGKVYKLIGESSEGFINGCYYKGTSVEETDGSVIYKWELIKVTESIDDRVAYKIAEVVAGAPDAFDTLKELADWIDSHGTEALELGNKVEGLTESVTNLQAEKLDIYQGGEELDKNVGKILVINEEGNITLSNNEGGKTDSESVSYDNATYEDLGLTNVKDALDTLLEKLYYVNTNITSFTAVPAGGVFKVGSTVGAPTFNWTVNKGTLSELTLTGCEVTVEDTTATFGEDITSDKTFTLSASDGKTSASKNITYKFVNPIYHGTSASSIIETLSGMTEIVKEKSNQTLSYTASALYLVFAYPQSYGNLTSIKDGNGFENISDFEVSVIEYNNVSYNVYVSKTVKNCDNFKYTFSF